MVAVALGGPGLDALDGEAADLVAEELLVLGEREVDALCGRGRCGSRGFGEHGHGVPAASYALLSTQSAITIFWISLVPS